MQTTASTLYPFVPSGPDFVRSLEFFAALNFEQVWRQDKLAALRFGGAFFLLQAIDVPDAAFPGVKLNPPADFPWGREITSSIPAESAGT